MGSSVAFEIANRSGSARRGRLTTPHGVVETPAFMPVGTQGAVKGLLHRDLHELGASILLSNTYHLYLRPGDGLIARLGGLHAFMGWPGPILTDSGGYQAFSLSARRDIDENGITFRSHLDGSLHDLTPERAVDIQRNLGSDVAMALDECLAHPASHAEAQASMERTLRWAARSRHRFLSPPDHPVNPGSALFGIVQGGVFPDLRRASADATVAQGFEGYAIGGLSVGEPADVMYDIVSQTAPLLPDGQPRYLMGVGTPLDIVEAVARGIDLFDCVLPTRNGRNGQLFTREGRLNIKNAQYAEDRRPADEGCGCYTCGHFSRAYLRHLHLAGEIASASLNTLHNLHFYLDTMRRIREAIVFGSLEELRQAFRRAYSPRSIDSGQP
jgi:queuine tRNA-ribosyltransferase